jgi:WD40 repeat protein/DNA-binding SARP family transcriptional activator/molybdopterin-guanine dinucleotide biosynthesis protein
MEFGILGPLEVRNERGEVAVAGGKTAAVLAVLLLHRNEPVSAERLAIALWGDEAPGGSSKTVQVYVSRLRKALGDPEILITTPAGYRLTLRADQLDAARFEALVRDGRHTLDQGEPAQASEVLRQALTLWRGPPLADFVSEPFAGAEISRLEEERLTALETRVEADLAAGRHADVVAELQHLVAEHPTREQLVAHLMLALYRCGRQAEGLEVYRDAYRVLLDDVGVEPGPRLRELHAAVLRQDPALDPPAPTELPELDPLIATPFVGRDRELAALRELWESARAGTGAIVAVTGARGSGKTRLTAELASAVHRRGAAVLSAAASEPASALFEAVARARESHAPTLLVLDDADEAAAEVRAELSQQLRAVAARPVLALVTGDDQDALADFGADATVVLSSLGREAVHEIALIYAPAFARDDIPDDSLLDASGGMPGHAHELAGEWARREAARRVNAVVGRAAAGRADLRMVESELADGVEALEATRERVARVEDSHERPVVCPFKGLASFEVADAPYFFGREQLVARLIARLVGAPMLGVIGPSGSGKSSVVQAGLLPALADGVLPGSEGWRQVVIRPGEQPMRALEAAAGVADAERFVLAVDQFEEVFTACRDERQREEFIDELVRLASRNGVVVLAIRADQYGHCTDYAELSALLAANQVLVGTMGRDELLRAVECPAERAGLRVDPALSSALLDDVEGEPGALPLLSAALLELWQRREGRRLTKAAYERTGGVHGAVARLGEDAFRALDADQQDTARGVLMALVTESSAGTVERRRISLRELEIERSDDVRRVVEVLTDRRLLTLSEGTVEVAHEALLREWPRLGMWIEEDRERIRIHRRLRSAAEDWLAHERNEDWLYRGSHLLEAGEWEEQGGPGLAGDEREFLAASRAYARRDRTAHRRRLGAVFGALVAALVAITLVAIEARHQRHDAEQQRNLTLSSQLGLEAERLVNSDPELGVRLALIALDTSRTDEAEVALRQATNAFYPYTELRADSVRASTAGYSRDGSRLVTGGADGVATVWDAATHRGIARLGAKHDVVGAARFSPGGDRIALGFADGAVLITDRSLSSPRELLEASDQPVASVAFSGDGRRVAAGLGDGTVRVLASNGSGEAQRLRGNADAVLGVDIDADGSRVVSAGADGSVRLWNVADGGTGSTVYAGDGESAERDVSFSPDGRRIMAAGDDGAIRFWDARTLVAEPTVDGEGRDLFAAAFSADGTRFAAGGQDGVTRVWSARGGPPVVVLRGQRSRVLDLGFGSTSNHIVSAAEDGTARIWDAGRTQSWANSAVTNNVDFSRDGRGIAAASADGDIRVWDPATGALQAHLDLPVSPAFGNFSPTENTMLIANLSPRARLWPISAKSARVAVRLPAGRAVWSADFDGTGDRIVYVDNKGAVVVRELASGNEVQLKGAPEKVSGVVFSADGRYVLGATDSDPVVWRVDRPSQPFSELKGHRGPVNEISIGPDDKMLTAGSDDTVRMWDPSGEPLVVMRGNEDELTTAIFTTDGTQVLSSGQDGSLRLYDADSGKQLAVLQSRGQLFDVAQSRDGAVATLGTGEVIRVFACDFCGSVDRVRRLALSRSPRQLTPGEKHQFLSAAG